MKTLAAYIYGLIVYLRNIFFNVGFLKQRKLPGKVISVGNIAVGGTGKSPVVVALGKELLSKGFRVVILTRGYKGGLGNSDWMVLQGGKRVAGNAQPSARPDEAFMQSQELPGVTVIVGAKRFKNAKKWLKENEGLSGFSSKSLVWILDDGFQHRNIARDLDIVLLDAKKPFGPLLPKGLFREQAEGLERAGVVLFTRADAKYPQSGDFNFVSLLSPKALVAKAPMIFEEPVLVFKGQASNSLKDDVKSMKFLIAAGIAKPEQFLEAAKAKGLLISNQYFCGDHEKLDLNELKRLSEGLDAVLTTAKDFARSEDVLTELSVPVYVLPMVVSLPELPLF